MATILVVDDEDDNLTSLRLLLSLEGYAVRTALNGALAIDIAVTGGIDLIISDSMMPVMNGVTLCRRLRADLRTRTIPIILNSAVDDPPPGEGELYERFLRKPVAIGELVRVIQWLLASRPEMP